jgi:hypothetical protein
VLAAEPEGAHETAAKTAAVCRWADFAEGAVVNVVDETADRALSG